MNQSKRDARGGPRIVVADDGQYRRCLLCGAAVAHEADHYEWHVQTDRLLAASLGILPVMD